MNEKILTFRGKKVKSKTLVASSKEELDHKINKLGDIYDLQFSTHYDFNKQSDIFCALALIELED